MEKAHSSLKDLLELARFCTKLEDVPRVGEVKPSPKEPSQGSIVEVPQCVAKKLYSKQV